MNKQDIKAFTISSSIILTIFTLSYIGYAFNNSGRPSSVPFEMIAIGIPITFGIFGIINHYVVKKYGINYSLLVGLLLGLFFSIVGRFYLNLPKLIFGYNTDNEWQVHLYAIGIYSLLFRFVDTPFQFYLK